MRPKQHGVEPFRPAPIEVPGSDKLMRLTGDLGDHPHTILAGIQAHWHREP